MNLRVAACQILTYPEVKRSADKIIEWIQKASDQDIDVVAFPEASLCGYQSTEEYWKKANPDDFVAEEKRIIEASKNKGIRSLCHDSSKPRKYSG